jgi:2,3-bisphosphoglycerate-dependent phosphoglycerate mutase
MRQLVLLRHGQSVWNASNRFTGWTDVDLTPIGVEEALRAGHTLREANFSFDVAFTSLLKRAIRTLWLALEVLDCMWIPVEKSWMLNERHYGALQGFNKAELAERYGKEQVFQWRRSYTVHPPELAADDSRHPRHDPRYSRVDPEVLPAGESLQDALLRVTSCWQTSIVPRVQRGECVLVVAHGNSIRALVKYLDHVPDREVHGLYIPTGIPLVYEMDAHGQAQHRYYLGDPQIVRAATEAAARASQVGDPEE